MFVVEVLENKQMLLTLLWAGIQVCLVAYTISAWVASGRLRSACNPEGGAFVDHHEGFALVWQSFLAIAISAGGTLVLKKHRNQLSLGVLIGASIMMSNWMLCIAVQEGGQSSLKSLLREKCVGATEVSGSADSAVSTFAVFLFLLYGAFGVVLARSKNDILGDDEPLMGMGGDASGGYVNTFPSDPVV